MFSYHCSVTFSKMFSNCLKHPKTLFDSRPTVAWPPTTVAWPFSDFFQKFFQLLDTSENSCLTVGRLSRQLRLGWNVEKMLFESQRTDTWRSGSFVPVVFFRTASHTASQMYISFISLLFVCSVVKYLAPEVVCQEMSSETSSSLEGSTTSIGSDSYMSKHSSSPKVDVWSLGIILLELVLVSSNQILYEWTFIKITVNSWKI